MEMQTAFNLMVQHLRTQGAPSSNGLECYYRHPDGIKRCAVGVLIPDSEYDRSFEGNAALALVDGVKGKYRVNCLQGLNDLTYDSLDYNRPKGFLTMMQQVHDDAVTHVGEIRPDFLARWEQGFQHVAVMFHLTVPAHPCQKAVQHEVNTVEVAEYSVV